MLFIDNRKEKEYARFITHLHLLLHIITLDFEALVVPWHQFTFSLLVPEGRLAILRYTTERDTSGHCSYTSLTVKCRFSRMMRFTFCFNASVMTEDRPDLSAPWTSVRTFLNIVHHFRTLAAFITGSPQTATSIRWISLGLTSSACKNRITPRISQSAGFDIGAFIVTTRYTHDVKKFAAPTASGNYLHSTEHTTWLIWYNETTARVVYVNVLYFPKIPCMYVYIYICICIYIYIYTYTHTQKRTVKLRMQINQYTCLGNACFEFWEAKYINALQLKDFNYRLLRFLTLRMTIKHCFNHCKKKHCKATKVYIYICCTL